MINKLDCIYFIISKVPFADDIKYISILCIVIYYQLTSLLVIHQNLQILLWNIKFVIYMQHIRIIPLSNQHSILVTAIPILSSTFPLHIHKHRKSIYSFPFYKQFSITAVTHVTHLWRLCSSKDPNSMGPLLFLTFPLNYLKLGKYDPLLEQPPLIMEMDNVK